MRLGNMVGDSKQAIHVDLHSSCRACTGYAFGIHDVDLTHLFLTVPFLRVQCLNKSTYIYHTESEPEDSGSLHILHYCP